MNQSIRHSPADCYIGDFFPVPVDAGDNRIWYYLVASPASVIDDPLITFDWPPRWTFHRAAWRSDSGPYVLDVFVRKT